MIERRLIDVENVSVTWDHADITKYGNDFEGGVLCTLDALCEREESVVRCKRCRFLVLDENGEHNPEDCVCAYWETDGLTDEDYCSRGEIGRYVHDPLDETAKQFEVFKEKTVFPVAKELNKALSEYCDGRKPSAGEVLAFLMELFRNNAEKGGEQRG